MKIILSPLARFGTATVLLSLAQAAYSGEVETWSRFRGPNGSGISEGQGFPVVFDQNKNVAWRTPVRPGKSSPVLTRTRVFLTAADGGMLYTICLDRKTGKILWERSINQPHTDVANRQNHGAAITPVTDGDNVYAFFKDFGIVAYDGAGNLRWKAALGPFTSLQGLGASPILAKDSVVLLADQWEKSYLIALDRATGETRWKAARDEKESWGTPVVHDSQVVTVSYGMLGLYDSANGKRTVTVPGLATTIVGSPVLDGDTVYAFGYGNATSMPFAGSLKRLDKNNDGKLTADEYGTDAVLYNIARYAGNRDGIVTEDKWNAFSNAIMGPSSLVAVRLEDGGARLLWRSEKSFTGVIPSPLAYQNAVFVIRNGGILTTHHPATGDVIKVGRLEDALGGYSSSPVGAEGKVWIASEKGLVSVVRAKGEWERIAVNDLREGCYASPALSDGVIYLRTEEALYAFAEIK